jgi:hypothetical protein
MCLGLSTKSGTLKCTGTRPAMHKGKWFPGARGGGGGQGGGSTGARMGGSTGARVGALEQGWEH